MTTTGYKNIPFTVSITMHALIHGDHFVKMFANDTRLTFPSSPGGYNLIFTPGNWNVPQDIVVNFNGVGDAELLARITNNYFVDGAGNHRVRQDIIDLSVTALPLDTWSGSTPRWDRDSRGDLQISHNNLVIGHKLLITASQVSGLASDIPFLSNPAYHFLVTQPDGTQFVTVPTSHNTLQVGVYTIQPITDFCQLQQSETGGHTLVISDFGFTVTDAGGTVLVPTQTAAGIKSQGFACKSSTVHFYGLSGPAINIPIIPTGYDDFNVLGTLSYGIGGAGTGPNATGSAAGGSSISITGVATGSPWGLNWSGGVGGIAMVDGVPVRGVGGYLQFSVSS